jgi:hypothetical protein
MRLMRLIAPFIFPSMFLFFGIVFLSASKKCQRNYKKIVKDKGERYANRVIVGLKIIGYIELGIFLLWVVQIVMSEG